MLDPTIQAIRFPAPQNAMMNLRKLPTDMNTNRYEKLMQVPSRGAERATSDGVKIAEYRPVDQRRSMTTVDDDRR